MANITVGQIIMEVQRMASRVKDLDAISSSLLVEAEGNNRMVESLRQFQDDMDSLNRISNNKTNAEMVNRIQQQNANSSEILKENRELKICLEDYELAMEMIMKKYREHIGAKILDGKMNLRELQNEKLWKIIREQREKINEMAAVMQRAAYADDEHVCRDLETMNRLRLENKSLRELLQISKQFGTTTCPIRFNELLLEEKGVQTEGDDSADELSLSGASLENANNNSVIHINGPCQSTTTIIEADVMDNMKGVTTNNTAVVIDSPRMDNATITTTTTTNALLDGADNNNGPLPAATLITPEKLTTTTTAATPALPLSNLGVQVSNTSPTVVAPPSEHNIKLNNSNVELPPTPAAVPSHGTSTPLELENANANTLKSADVQPVQPPSSTNASAT